MSLFMTDTKNKNHPTKAKAKAELDALDKEFAFNPGDLDSSNNLAEEFKKIFEDSLQNTEFKSGKVVEGSIIKVTDDHVIVDINYKSEGIIPKSEFQVFNGEQEPAPGQKVDVYIEQIENKDGVVVLSKDKANIKKVWQDITRAKENDELIKGKVIAAVKGGLSVDIGIKAFLPGSQIDLRPVRKLNSFIGQTLDLKIIKMNHKRGNIVLSRRQILEKEREKLSPTIDIKEGALVKGIVKNITDYGAFIDLGNKDGLLHITDMSWSRIEHPSHILQIGQELDLKVLKYDTEKKRISLGMKQLTEEKWEQTVSKYQEGSIVKGTVSSIVDYGAFISLEKGLEGLSHVNELSWTRKIKHPSQILKIGEEVKVKIIEIKKDSRKLSLSLKQAQKNPWLDIKDKFKVGDVGEFEVVSISDFGFFVKVNELIDGLIRVYDISWTENINPFEKYKVGDKVKAKVLEIDPPVEKFSLGIKQLKANPWSLVEENYPIGSRHEVKITRIADFGVFVRIQENIEGLIHISELSRKRIDKPQDHFKVGDKVKAEILSIDKDAKKIALSIRLAESSSKKTTTVKAKSSSGSGFMENFFAKALKKSMKIKDNKPEEADKSANTSKPVEINKQADKDKSASQSNKLNNIKKPTKTNQSTDRDKKTNVTDANKQTKANKQATTNKTEETNKPTDRNKKTNVTGANKQIDKDTSNNTTKQTKTNKLADKNILTNKAKQADKDISSNTNKQAEATKQTSQIKP